MRVGDLLSGEVISCEPSDSVREAARTMTRHKVGSVVVVQDGTLAGILTERDVLKGVAEGIDLGSTKVSELMTRAVVTVTPDWEVYEAAAEMLARRFRHLVVVDADAVVGVVSMRDVLLAGKRIELDSGNWAVLRDPLTFTVRERRALQRYLMRLRDAAPGEAGADELIGLLVGAWSYDLPQAGDFGEVLHALPQQDYEALVRAALAEIPKLQRAVHPAPGWRSRSARSASRSA